VSEGDLSGATESELPPLHDRPTVREIVEAVREWLERDVMSSPDRRLAFNGRVAVNMLGIVERELRDGPSQRTAHAERLAALGCSSDAELAAAIRSGALDDRYAEVKAALVDAVADKVAVANPKYALIPSAAAAPPASSTRR
jgi:Domain of unknown function (DUF6285)